MKLCSLFLIIIFQITSIVWAQNDSIPKKNKEAKMHAGAYYAMGLSRYYVNSPFSVESDIIPYKNFGFLLELKLYKKLWLELNINEVLQREGKINFTQDTFNADILVKVHAERTCLVYLKYQILNKSKWTAMAKLGIGYGNFIAETYSKEHSKRETKYSSFPGIIVGNSHYYSISTGFDVNYRIKKHFIIFNQVLLNWGTNLFKEPENIQNGRLSRSIYTETLIPQTLIYSIGLKF